MLKRDWDDLHDNKRIGDWYFMQDDRYIVLTYPNLKPQHFEDAIEVVSLPIHTAGQEVEKQPSWLWDGNKEAPTLSPSINVIDRWHGYLKNGIIETV